MQIQNSGGRLHTKQRDVLFTGSTGYITSETGNMPRVPLPRRRKIFGEPASIVVFLSLLFLPQTRLFFLPFSGYISGQSAPESDPCKMDGDYLRLFAEETNFYNGIVLGNLFPENLWKPLPHVFQTWLRNYIGGMILYFVSGGLWSFYIYYWKRHIYLPKDSVPSNESILLQIMVTMKAMPCYSVLPTVSEYMVEKGWMRCFSSISEIGWPAYLVYLIVYLVIVEFGIYWMHRELHDIKPLYKHLHATHHIYNKQNTLSPFAGLAFHPLDGILQALPHVIALFLVPTHFTTHIILLFLEAIWTTNIHDCIHGKVWPVMGAGYHTIHHTTYRHNYGHYTIWMDWMFGTLRDPEVEPKKAS